MAGTTKSHSMSYSEPSTGETLLRPDSSGSPSFILMSLIPRTSLSRAIS
jgi:hypothetical protein